MKEITKNETEKFIAHSEAQKSQIQSLETSKEWLTKVKNHTTDIVSRRFDEEMDSNLARRVFNKWSHMTKCTKNVCIRLESTIRMNITRETFRCFKMNCELGWRQEKQLRILAIMGKSIHKKRMESALYVWKRVTRLRRKAATENRWVEMNESLAKTTFYFDKVHKNSLFHVIKIIIWSE